MVYLNYINMDPKVEETINFVRAYAPDISDWKILKRELLKSLPSSHRGLLSTKDHTTKKSILNDLEKAILKHWLKITGVELYLE